METETEKIGNKHPQKQNTNQTHEFFTKLCVSPQKKAPPPNFNKMVSWGSITQNDEITKIPIPTVTGLFIGAVAGAIVWLIIYRSCPKPAFLDKILDWLFGMFADRRGGPPHHHERPRTTTAYMTLNGNNNGSGGGPSRQNIELQDHHRIPRRRGSPTETIETIISGSDLSTPEPPMLVSSEEESD